MTTTPPTIIIPSWDGNSYSCHPRVQHYSNGRLALELWIEEDGMMEPMGKITVNLPDEHLNEGEIFVKDWAENEILASTLLEFGWLEKTGREVNSGFVFPLVARPAGALKEFLDREGG
jgi:Domain of unknown function (DUF4313)